MTKIDVYEMFIAKIPWMINFFVQRKQKAKEICRRRTCKRPYQFQFIINFQEKEIKRSFAYCKGMKKKETYHSNKIKLIRELKEDDPYRHQSFAKL